MHCVTMFSQYPRLLLTSRLVIQHLCRYGFLYQVCLIARGVPQSDVVCSHHIITSLGELLVSEAHPDTTSKPAREHCPYLRPTLTLYQSLPGSTACVWGPPWHYIKACPGALLVSEAHPDTTSKPAPGALLVSQAHPDTTSKPAREHCSCLRPTLTPHQSLPGSTACVWGPPWYHIKTYPGALLVSEARPDTTSKPTREHCLCLRPTLTPH